MRDRLVTTALLLIVLAGCRNTRPPAAARRVSPEQQRMDDLLRLNTGRPSDPDLADAYGVVNAQYFENRLPPARIRWEEGLDRVGPMIAENFRLEGVTNGELILLHPVLAADPQQLRAVLCHEMVHVALRDRPEDHGPEFQARLRALAERGAFVGIVATDAEKEELKTTLQRTSQRLSQEITDLRALQQRIEAEAPSMPREAVQDRVWDFNKRVREHNEAADDFNRQVERYNLMITYPDGLDRERLTRKTGVSELAR